MNNQIQEQQSQNNSGILANITEDTLNTIRNVKQHNKIPNLILAVITPLTLSVKYLSLSLFTFFLYLNIYLSEFVVLILVLALKKEFKDKRKKHYNEYSKVKLARKLIEQELKDLEDDNDSVENNTKEGPSSSQDGADIQVITSICCNNQTSWSFPGDK